MRNYYLIELEKAKTSYSFASDMLRKKELNLSEEAIVYLNKVRLSAEQSMVYFERQLAEFDKNN